MEKTTSEKTQTPPIISKVELMDQKAEEQAFDSAIPLDLGTPLHSIEMEMGDRGYCLKLYHGRSCTVVARRYPKGVVLTTSVPKILNMRVTVDEESFMDSWPEGEGDGYSWEEDGCTDASRRNESDADEEEDFFLEPDPYADDDGDMSFFADAEKIDVSEVENPYLLHDLSVEKEREVPGFSDADMVQDGKDSLEDEDLWNSNEHLAYAKNIMFKSVSRKYAQSKKQRRRASQEKEKAT